MKSTIYIYTRTGTTPILQIFDAMNISMSSKTNESSVASFDIPLYRPDGSIHPSLTDIAYLSKTNRVKISLIENNIETIQYEGYISGVSDKSGGTQVTLSDNLGILESRIITVDTNFTSVAINTLLTSVFSTMNGVDNTGITVSSSTTDVVTRTYTAGQSIMNIVQDLAGDKYQYIIKNNILYFGTTIGDDLSSGENYVEFRYDYLEGRSRTISDFSMDSQLSNINNTIYAKPASGPLVSSIDTASKDTYGMRENLIPTNDGSVLATEVAKYLAEHKDDITEISVYPITYNYSLANPGDIVKVYIDRGDIRGKYIGTMRVVSKEYVTQGDLPLVTFSLSSAKIRTPNILEKLKKMNDDIKNLKTL